MSAFDEIQTACEVRYPYLWAGEAGKGETEGRKHRPVAVGVRTGISSCFSRLQANSPHRIGSLLKSPIPKSAGRVLILIFACGSF